MSATHNPKPPRPCTEYNIFFQLERAFILQVNLKAEPDSDDAAKIFHLSQPTYSGLPPLPRRYASLILTYDWFLPGKEQRRKRKHRKSHGVISFHDLSAMVATAWKTVDHEIKSYCSQVYAFGKIRYKIAMQEWKQRGGEQAAPGQQMMKKMGYESQMRQSAEVNIVNKIKHAYKPKRSNHTLKESTLNSRVQGMAQVQAHQEVAAREMNNAFNNELLLGDALAATRDTIACMWGTDVEPSRVSMVSDHQVDMDDNDIMYMHIKSSSIVNPYQQQTNQPASRRSSEPVDMDDTEIIGMWNETSAAAANPDLMFGGRGWDAVIQDIHAMKAMLDLQMLQLEHVRQRTFDPPSA
ncbi:hypothetical protein ACHAW5_007830 [Stephanodiscus triporus]|uniref:HMG box domain-containing protein n=1 Tax=Stephanodiscus triporus TaxID=2934178 RepID=A0ABD3N069_9STRA